MELGIILGLFGIILALLGIFLTFVTFFVPHVVLNFSLNRPGDWKKIIGVNESLETYRNRIFSGFSIVIDWRSGATEGYYEQWLDNTLALDSNNNRLYSVEIRFNGVLTLVENFISFDGGRYFVPQPRVKIENGRRRWRIEQMQRNLYHIIGYCYDITDFETLSDAIENSPHPANRIEFTSLIDLERKIEEFKRQKQLT